MDREEARWSALQDYEFVNCSHGQKFPDTLRKKKKISNFYHGIFVESPFCVPVGVAVQHTHTRLNRCKLNSTVISLDVRPG